jgi:hypothetical protein
MKEKTVARRQQVIAMKLGGMTYQEIGAELGFSRQYAEQLGSPPKSVLRLILQRSGGVCEDCGVTIKRLGHTHHFGTDIATYQDPVWMRYLCVRCHRHSHTRPVAGKTPRDNTVTLVCDVCGVVFTRRLIDVQRAIDRSGLAHICCTRRCYGKWFAKTHGFGTPRNSRWPRSP